MKRMKFAVSAFALICALTAAGCGSGDREQTGSKETAVNSQSEAQPDSRVASADRQSGAQTDTEPALADSRNRMQPDNADTGDSGSSSENPVSLDELLESVLLRGSVSGFQEGSFQVIPDQDDGEMIMSAAPGMESSMESTNVSYGEDCVFQIAKIDASTNAVDLEEASSSDVKKSTSVYVYGETLENGEIHAENVLIIRFE